MNRKIYPFKRYQPGEQFDFYAAVLIDRNPFKMGEIVDMWLTTNDDGIGLSKPEFAGRARIVSVPQSHTGLYTAEVLIENF